jgi:molybdopterin-biosynthesis enzyme MoeA-like protein
MKNIIVITLVLLIMLSSLNVSPQVISISNSVLKDKIAGGWAGKMIGVTYGAPVEFKAMGETFNDPINWKPSDVVGSVWQDDLYVQLTFMMAMDIYGTDAPAKTFQEMFAKSGYPLWHANVQARKNYFDQIFPPESGLPENNIHADDIDFQIEADYLGFMCPGMPQTFAKMASKVGHIMNYGDGLYGGVFMSSLYTQAFFETDIEKIIEQALLSIPAQSDYAKAISDVILLHTHYPSDWHAAWKELNAKWGHENICEAGGTFNIDAKLNGAFVALGLLYGDGNPEKTLEITTRCGQDADCNPSNALAVLGIIGGFSHLPAAYQAGVVAMGDSLFEYTTYSFNKAVKQTFVYAQKLALQNGGKVTNDGLEIKIQKPEPLPFEVAFPDVVFDKKSDVFDNEGWSIKGKWEEYLNWDKKKQALFSNTKGDEISFTFNGTGVSLTGNWLKTGGKADVYVDNEFKRTIDCYFYYANQQHDNMSLYHITGLPEGPHSVKLVVKGEKRSGSEGENIYVSGAIVFKTAKKPNEEYKFSFQK